MAAKLTDDQVRAKLALLDAFVKSARFDVWDMIVPIYDPRGLKLTGLHGEFADWPAEVQDAIMAAMVLQCIPKAGNGIKIVASGCYQDAPDEPCYLRVVVHEIPPPLRHCP